MRKFVAVFLAVIIILLMVFIAIFANKPAAVETIKNKEIHEAPLFYKEKEEALIIFIEENFLCENGELFTNIKPGAGGLETLSESVGLMMNYSVLRDRKDLFDREFEYLKKSMLAEGYYIRWRTGHDEVFCNAAIDDLRILGALLDAHEKWESSEYIETAQAIQAELFEKQTEKGGLYEFYDWKSKVSRKSIPLCYLDMYNLQRLESFNKGWLSVGDGAREILENGRISSGTGQSPFFNKYYNYQGKIYSKDEEFAKGKGICLTFTLYTVLHMAEMNEDTEFFTSWLKNEMQKGKLYAWYNPITLKPAQEMESTAVYALAAIYAKKVGENELNKKLLDKMLKFRINDEKSPYYGGFGNKDTMEFYSFDNLTALLALATNGQ